MAFKMRSGNKPGFKNMGSSPVKQTTDKGADLKEWLITERGFNQEDADRMIQSGAYSIKDIDPGFKRKIVNAKKSTAEVKKGSVAEKKSQENWEPAYEGGDYSQKEIDAMTEKEKKTKITDYDPKLDKKKGQGDSTPEKKTKSPAKQRKVMKDGAKNKAVFHDGRTNKDPHWQPHQFKDKYWYKIDGKQVTKAQYIKYKNVPGNMEGGGKTTNDPDVYGKKANNHGRGPKTKK